MNLHDYRYLALILAAEALFIASVLNIHTLCILPKNFSPLFSAFCLGVLIGVAIVVTLSVVLLLALAKVAGAECKRRHLLLS